MCVGFYIFLENRLKQASSGGEKCSEVKPAGGALKRETFLSGFHSVQEIYIYCTTTV